MDKEVHGAPLQGPPGDGVTQLQFCEREGSRLLASSWDTQLYLHDADRNLVLGKWAIDARPLLSVSFADEDCAALTGGLGGTLHKLNLETSHGMALGNHAGPVSCAAWLPNHRLAVSASWDGEMRVWDPRVAPGGTCVARVDLGGKAYRADVSVAGGKLLVATSARQVAVFDLRQSGREWSPAIRDSPLRHQTRAIAAYRDGSGYAIASTEGRVAMEYIDPVMSGRKYAFKCHRRKEEMVDVVFPVNALAFHPVHQGSFATGGSDGVVNIWDRDNKKRLHQIVGYPTSIASLAFNASGSLLAVASSYMFEQGDVPHPSDAIYVKRIHDSEVRPKPRQQ